MKHPTLSELIDEANTREVTAEWDRRDELMTRFHGLSRSTLNTYQREMETIPEFKEGVIKPTPSVTWININTFIWYLKWKEANRYMVKKVAPNEIL